MESKKIIKELTRRGLEFRGEISIDEAKKLNVISDGEIGYAAKTYDCSTFLYFAKREAPKGGKVGDAGTSCFDLLLTVDNTKDDTRSHCEMKHSWHVPALESKENPDGVYYLETDDDCHITSCSHICGCCSTTGWHFDEWWEMPYSDKTRTAFDAVADCKGDFGFLPETCTPTHVGRPGYRN